MAAVPVGTKAAKVGKEDAQPDKKSDDKVIIPIHFIADWQNKACKDHPVSSMPTVS